MKVKRANNFDNFRAKYRTSKFSIFRRVWNHNKNNRFRNRNLYLKLHWNSSRNWNLQNNFLWANFWQTNLKEPVPEQKL